MYCTALASDCEVRRRQYIMAAPSILRPYLHLSCSRGRETGSDGLIGDGGHWAGSKHFQGTLRKNEHVKYNVLVFYCTVHGRIY